jgi:hypothetical protein
MISKIYKGKTSYLMEGPGVASDHEKMMKMAQQQMAENRPSGNSADIAKLRNSFGGEGTTSGSKISHENPKGFSPSSEIGHTLAKVSESVVKAPISIGKAFINAGVSLGQPNELKFDNVFEKVVLEGPATVKKIFLGIGSFFNSIPEALGIKKNPKQK